MKKKENKIFKMLTIFLINILILSYSSCSKPQVYEFHFSVIDGCGEIYILEHMESSEIAERDNVYDCSSYLGVIKHKINCPDNSRVVLHYSSDSLTFVAVPEEGYEVNEWRNNGNIVKNETSNEYKATAYETNPIPYTVVISVSFKRKAPSDGEIPFKPQR